MFSLGTLRSQSEGIFRKLMFSNNLQRKIPGFEETSVNIFLMRKYAQENVLDPDVLLLKIEQ